MVRSLHLVRLTTGAVSGSIRSRYAFLRDMAKSATDGTLILLSCGSVGINTAAKRSFQRKSMP